MIDLLRIAVRVQGFLDGQGWRSCVIGGIAVHRWGHPRLTYDVDVTLLTGFGDEEKYVDGILGQFAGRRADARAFALARRVILVVAEGGTEIDVALGGLPFEERVVGRASDFEYYPGITLRTCSAEDLIVMKAFAERDMDWGDIRSIVARQGRTLKWRLVMSELKPLCRLKESPEILDKLKRLRASIES